MGRLGLIATAERLLVALTPTGGLFAHAKDLFVAAIVAGPRRARPAAEGKREQDFTPCPFEHERGKANAIRTYMSAAAVQVIRVRNRLT